MSGVDHEPCVVHSQDLESVPRLRRTTSRTHNDGDAVTYSLTHFFPDSSDLTFSLFFKGMVSLSQHEDDMHQSGDTHNPSASSSSSVSATVPPSRITFQVAATHLPPELLLRVLQEWVGPQRVALGGSGHSTYTLSYINPENTDPFTIISNTSETSSSIFKEYFRSRVHSWLTDTKEFDDPTTFYLSHLLMSLKMDDDRLDPDFLPNHPWDTMLQDPNLALSTTFSIVKDHNAQYVLFSHLSSLHGLEKIKLDFTAEQYFAMFDVAVPPFHYRDDAVAGDNLYRDEYCHSAGLFLAHTKELELHFGDAYKYTNPWYNVQEDAWCETNDDWDYGEARLRPRICESGTIIDWVLEYAWYGGHFQHIRKITLTGDVQQWVKEKWYGIFKHRAEYVDAHPGEKTHVFAVYTPDPTEMETIGMVDDGSQDDDDEAWMPRNHYPPRCTCEIGCWRLRGGKIEEELRAKSWDDFEQYSVEVVGDWMDSVELDLLCTKTLVFYKLYAQIQHTVQDILLLA